MTEPRFTMKLVLTDPMGRTVYARAVELPLDVCQDLEREVGGMRLARDLGVGMVSMDRTVKIMRQRVFRRDQFVQYATQMGGQMADFMEDKEGWHGADRAETARDVAKEFDR